MPGPASGKQLDTLRSMKFMQRKQEARRREAHETQQQRRGTATVTSVAEPAEPAEPGVVASALVRVIDEQDIDTGALAAVSHGRRRFGAACADFGTAAPPAMEAAPVVEDDTAEYSPGGAPSAEAGAKQKRFYPPEASRAPPLPRGFGGRGDGGRGRGRPGGRGGGRADF